MHFTQTCDEEAPQLITHVETTQAPISDEGVLSVIHTALAEKKLLPGQHLVDAGYVTSANLVRSQSGDRVDLVGPTLKGHTVCFLSDCFYPLLALQTYLSGDCHLHTLT